MSDIPPGGPMKRAPGAGLPPDNAWYVRWLRFLDMLDDAENKLSPVKFNLWSANIAGAGTVLAGMLAWVGHHVEMLNAVGQIGSLVGPYWSGSHVWHQVDKRINK